MKRLVISSIVVLLLITAGCSSQQYVAQSQTASATFKGKNPKARYKSEFGKKRGTVAIKRSRSNLQPAPNHLLARMVAQHNGKKARSEKFGKSK